MAVKTPTPAPQPASQAEEEIEEAPEEVPEEVVEEKVDSEEAPESMEKEEEAPGEEPEKESKEKIEEGEEAEEKQDIEEREEGEVLSPAPKSWAGRLLIFAGAACIIAGLFLPWALPDTLKEQEAASATDGAISIDQPKEPGTHGLIEEEKPKESDSKEEAPHAAPSEGENIGWRNAGVDVVVVAGEEATSNANAANTSAPAAAAGPKGWEIPKIFAAKPVFYAIYGLTGSAILLAVIALLPGVILKGGVQKITGLILSLACAGSLGAVLFGINQVAASAGGLAALFGQHQIGFILTIIGGAACFLGGIICTFGVFGTAAPASTTKDRSRMAARSTVRMLPRRPESAAEAEGMPTKPPSKIRPPLRPPSGRPASVPLRPPPSARKPASATPSSGRPAIAPKTPLRPPPKGGAAPSTRKK